MSNNSSEIYTLYKPFRNFISDFELIDTMYCVWSYGNNLQFSIPLPDRIEPHPEYKTEADIFDRRLKSFPEWDLEFVLNEAILNSPMGGRQDNSLAKFKFLRSLFNKFRLMNEKIDDVNVSTRNVILEFNRIAHRQFPWQYFLDIETIYRYFRIYSHLDTRDIFSKVFSMLPFDFYVTGIVVAGHFKNNFSVNFPMTSSASFITNDMLAEFFRHFSSTYQEIQASIKQEQQMNERLLYSFNPVRAKPILVFGKKAYCPLPTQLLFQITNGVFYSLFKQKGFDNAIGKSFEDYTGYIIKKVIGENLISVYPEHGYGNDNQRSVDWIVEDTNARIFIECKAKRMTIASKSTLELDDMSKDLGILADAVVQAYTTFIDYKMGYYQFGYNPDKKHIILVVTMEDWFLFNHVVADEVGKKVREKFSQKGIDPKIITEVPYSVMSIHDFEGDFQIICKFGIQNYFTDITNEKTLALRKGFPFVNITRDDFIKELYEPVDRMTQQHL